MKALAYLIALAAGLSGTAGAQNTDPREAGANVPQVGGAATIPGNRDPGAKAVPVPSDNPGSTSVDQSVVEGAPTSNQTSDRTTSREWQGLGSTGGSTGTGTSSGTVADETAPGQDGSRVENSGTGDAGGQRQAAPEKRAEPPREKNTE